MNEAELMQVADDMVGLAKEMYVKDKRLTPVAFGISGTRIDIIPIGEFLRNDTRKSMLKSFMHKAAKAKGYEAILLLTEAWVLRGIKEIPDCPPSEHPDRVEVISCTLEFQDIIKVRTIDIGNGEVKADSGWEAMDRSEGRMMGLLPR